MSHSTTKGIVAPGPTAYLAMSLVAGAVMLFEIALTRILSFAIWHHFAFMVISIALLGFGVSGVALELWPRFGQPASRRGAVYAASFGVTALIAVRWMARLPLAPERIGGDASQALYLALFCLAFTVPFTFAGLCVISLLRGYPGSVHPLYAADLVGAGAGSLVAVLALRPLGAEGLVLGAAVMSAAAATSLAADDSRRSGGPLLGPAGLAALTVALAGALPWAGNLLPVSPGPTKGLAGILAAETLPAARVAHTEWSPIGRVDAVEDGGGVVWTSNPVAGTRSPPQVLLIIDGDAATPVVEWGGDLANPGFLDFTLSSTALQVFGPERVLVLGAGGGVDVLTALHHGARRVDAVEINDVVVDLVTGRYADFGGRLFFRDDVILHRSEGRSFIRRSDQRWDAIQLSLIDTWAASTSGAYVLSEGYLYTVEAFVDYLEHLEPEGVLTLTRWVWETPRESLKLAVIARQALLQLGASNPGAHLAIVGSGALGNLIVKRSPFTLEELSRLRDTAVARGFHFLYAPGLQADNAFTRYFGDRHPEQFVDAYPYDVSAVTDDAPFFFQFGRWSDLWADPMSEADVAGSSGRGLLLLVLVLAVVATLVLMVLPLWARRTGDLRLLGGSATLGYFFLIGVGFMLVEISLMQRFTLYLGHPIYAVSLVLAVLLGAAGVGSYASRRARGVTGGLFVALVGLIALYALALPWLFDATLGSSLLTRIVIGAGLLLPLGGLLGAPLPMGLAQLSGAGDTRLMAWAWAANGCGSVIGPILATVLALDLGFARVGLCAGLVYAVAYLALTRGWSVGPSRA